MMSYRTSLTFLSISRLQVQAEDREERFVLSIILVCGSAKARFVQA
ncbi:hypothetical protein SEEC0818_008545 [Salmonella enterica subsp. enterica serovar Cerro str. 818]